MTWSIYIGGQERWPADKAETAERDLMIAATGLVAQLRAELGDAVTIANLQAGSIGAVDVLRVLDEAQASEGGQAPDEPEPETVREAIDRGYQNPEPADAEA